MKLILQWAVTVWRIIKTLAMTNNSIKRWFTCHGQLSPIKFECCHNSYLFELLSYSFSNIRERRISRTVNRKLVLQRDHFHYITRPVEAQLVVRQLTHAVILSRKYQFIYLQLRTTAEAQLAPSNCAFLESYSTVVASACHTHPKITSTQSKS